MESTASSPELRKSFNRFILQEQKFGRRGLPLIWLKVEGIESVARLLCEEESLGYDFLENISVMQVDDALVVTYFFRGSSGPLILRSAVPIPKEGGITLPSIRGFWGAAEIFEKEAAQRFNLVFSESPKAVSS